jgi:K+-sensing histidine kinase KdpD
MVAARALLTPVLGYELPFITLFPAVFVAAWLGGLGPAVVAATAGAGAALYLFFPDALSFPYTATVAHLGAAIFVVTGIAVGWLGQARLRAQARSEAAARDASTSQERYRALIE